MKISNVQNGSCKLNAVKMLKIIKVYLISCKERTTVSEKGMHILQNWI
jgi:hypothetical protein